MKSAGVALHNPADAPSIPFSSPSTRFRLDFIDGNADRFAEPRN